MTELLRSELLKLKVEKIIKAAFFLGYDLEGTIELMKAALVVLEQRKLK